MINYTIKNGAIEMIRTQVNAITPRVKAAVRRVALDVVRSVKQDYLSGQVLNVVTGRLRRSITAQFVEENMSIRATIGTNVKYARPHELGFHGTVTVPEHNVREFTRQQTMAFGKPIDPRQVTVRAHTVRSHSMNMNVKATPFLRPALEALRPYILNTIAAAAKAKGKRV